MISPISPGSSNTGGEIPPELEADVAQLKLDRTAQAGRLDTVETAIDSPAFTPATVTGATAFVAPGADTTMKINGTSFLLAIGMSLVALVGAVNAADIGITASSVADKLKLDRAAGDAGNIVIQGDVVTYIGIEPGTYRPDFEGLKSAIEALQTETESAADHVAAIEAQIQFGPSLAYANSSILDSEFVIATPGTLMLIATDGSGDGVNVLVDPSDTKQSIADKINSAAVTGFSASATDFGGLVEFTIAFARPGAIALNQMSMDLGLQAGQYIPITDLATRIESVDAAVNRNQLATDFKIEALEEIVVGQPPEMTDPGTFAVVIGIGPINTTYDIGAQLNDIPFVIPAGSSAVDAYAIINALDAGATASQDDSGSIRLTADQPGPAHAPVVLGAGALELSGGMLVTINPGSDPTYSAATGLVSDVAKLQDEIADLKNEIYILTQHRYAVEDYMAAHP